MEIRAGRRILSVLLIIALSVTMLFVNYDLANAETRSEIIEGTVGEHYTYSLNRNTGEIIFDMKEEKNDPVVKWWDSDLYNPDFSNMVKKIILTENVKRAEEFSFEVELVWSFRFAEEIEVAEMNTDYASQEGVFFNKDKTILYGYPVMKKDKSYKIPNSVSKIGTEEKMFRAVCPFEFCQNLKSIVIPASVTDISYYSFANQDQGGGNSIEEFVVDENNEKYKSVGGVLFSKNGEELIAYPKGNSSKEYIIPNDVKIIKPYAFSGARDIKKIVMSEGVEIIGNSAFSDLVRTDGKEIMLPSSVNNIGDYALCGNGYLVNFEQGTGIEVFPANAFLGGTDSFVRIPCNLNWSVGEDIAEQITFIRNHAFTNYVYNNDAKVGVDGTETAVCDNGCGATDTRTKPGTALEDSGTTGGGSTGGGGGFVPPVSVQKPTIAADAHADFELSADGTKVTVKVKDGYELEDVKLNGESLGKVTVISNLKTGDKVTISTRKKLTDEEQAELDRIERIKKGVQATTLKARSKAYKGKTKIYWTKSWGYKVDGYNVYKSTKKDGKYTFMGKTKKKYMYHTKKLKKGTRYYYYIQGYRTIGNEKVYTKKSLKAIRTAK